MILISPPSTLPSGSTVWAYLRDSGGQEQDRSVERQRRSIQNYTKKHGLILARIFADVAKTGTTTAGRDDFHRMMLATREAENRPDGLLVWNFARFARNTNDAIYNKAVLRQRGIVIHSLTDPIPEGPYARLIETMIETANEEKSRQTSIDVRASLAAMVRQGAMPGKPPVGFKRTPIETINPRTGKVRKTHRWDPDPAYTHRIRKAYKMLVAGATLRQISAETKLYKNANQYNRLFKNPLYIGILTYGDITIEDYCEPIIEKELWDEVQRIIKSRAQGRHLRNKKTHPRTKNGSYLLTGLLRCHKCDAALVGMSSPQRNGRVYRRYQCTTAKVTRGKDCAQKPIPAQHLEDTVREDIINFIQDPTSIAAMLDEARQMQNSQQSTIDAERNTINDQLAKVNSGITNLTNAIIKAGHSDALLASLEHLELDKTELQSKLAQLNAAEGIPIPTLTEEQIRTHAAMLVARLKQKDPAQVRQVLKSIVETIIVDRNDKELNTVITFYQRKTSTGNDPPEAVDNDEDEGIITVSLFPSPVEVPTYRHSIARETTIRPQYVYKRENRS